MVIYHPVARQIIPVSLHLIKQHNISRNYASRYHQDVDIRGLSDVSQILAHGKNA